MGGSLPGCGPTLDPAAPRGLKAAHMVIPFHSLSRLPFFFGARWFSSA